VGKVEYEHERKCRETFGLGFEGRIEGRGKVEVKGKIKINRKIKINSKGNGQDCPFHMGERDQQAAWGAGGDDVHGEGDAEGICNGETLWGQPTV
jgi:hypothetical protein